MKQHLLQQPYHKPHEACLLVNHPHLGSLKVDLPHYELPQSSSLHQVQIDLREFNKDMRTALRYKNKSILCWQQYLIGCLSSVKCQTGAGFMNYFLPKCWAKNTSQISSSIRNYQANKLFCLQPQRENQARCPNLIEKKN